MTDTNCPYNNLTLSFCNQAACTPDQAQHCPRYVIEEHMRVLNTFNHKGVSAHRHLPHYQRAALAAQLKLGHLALTAPDTLRLQEIHITHGRVTRHLAILAPDGSPFLKTDHIDITNVPDVCPKLAAPDSRLWLPSREVHQIADNPILGQSGIILTPLKPERMSYDPADVDPAHGSTLTLASALLYRSYRQMFPDQAAKHQMPPRSDSSPKF